MSFRGLPLDGSGFIRMDSFGASDPDELPGLPDADHEPVPRLDEWQLESLLQRVLDRDLDADESLLPAGGEVGPFDAADGASGAPDRHAPEGDDAGPIVDPAAHEAGPAGDDPVVDAGEWPEARDPASGDHDRVQDEDLGWDS